MSIQFAVLIPRICLCCKRDHHHAPELRNFQPLGEAAMICKDCLLRPQYALVTKTDAMRQFGLTEIELAKLSFFTKTTAKGYKMKLYLESQLKTLVGKRDGDSSNSASICLSDATGGRECICSPSCLLRTLKCPCVSISVHPHAD